MSKQSRRPPQEEKPARRSWRGQAQNGAAAARVPAAQTGWRQGRAPRNYLARKWMIGVPMIVAVLGLFAAWAVFTFRLPPPTPLVTAYVTDYESPLEPHAFALEDVEQLLQLFRPAGRTGSITVRGNVADREIKATDKDRFLAQLKEDLLAQKPVRRWGQNKPQLIYLSAQGVLNEAGEPCLVLAAGQRDAGAATIRTPRHVLPEERLVRVEDVVDLVSQVHEHAHKVLLLDCVRSDRNWRLGIAANEFAGKLDSIKLNTPARERVVLLHACSAGEVGLVDPRKGLTLFGQYVARGLAGEADADRDEQVELRELHTYLKDRLQAAAERRGRTQQPLLHAGSDKLDFPLATADALAKKAAEEQFERARFQPAASWLDEIHAGWTALAERRARSGQSLAAASLLIDEAQRQHWQQQLKYCLAGQAYANFREAFSIKAAGGDLGLPGVSLPLALGRPDLTADEEQRARAELMPPPADQPAPAQAQAPLPASPEEYHALAAVVWNEALQGVAPSSFASTKLAEARLQSEAMFPVELRTLERFGPQNSHLPKTVRDASDVLRQFLICRHEAERAAFVQGQPRVLPLVQFRLDQADKHRREREDAAFGGQIDGEALAQLQQELGAVQTEAASVATAFSTRDRMWADLPYLLEWAVVEGQQQQTQAAALLEGLAALEKALAAPAGTAADWPKLTGKVEAAERELRRSYADQWRANVELTPAEGVLSQVPALERLLAAPVANLDARRQLWDKYWGIVAGPTSAERPANYSQETARVAQQKDAAVKLLAQWLNTAPSQAGADERRLPAAAQFVRLMDAAAAAIGRVEAKDLADDRLREQLVQHEPLARAAASWLTLGPSSSLRSHVIGQRAELAAYDYCLWQARRSLEDFLGNDDRLAADGSSPAPPGLGERPYFALAAGQLLKHAERLLPKRKAAAAMHELLTSRERDAGQLASVLLAWPREPLPTGQNSVLVDRLPNPLEVQSLPPGQAAIRASGEWKQVAMGEASGSLVPLAGDVLLAVQPGDSGWPARFEFTLDESKPDLTSASGDVSYYYRGHAATSRGHIDRLQPRYRVVSVSPGSAGKLVVDSPTVRAKVVILLDCSESMKEPSGREGTRLERGKRAVRDAIGDLLALNDDRAAGDVKVALVLFGHRRKLFAWPQAGGKSAIGWNEKFGPDDPAVSYDRDFAIEWVSSKDKAKDRESLDKLLLDKEMILPTGFTPLYGAMDFALANGFTKLGGRDAEASQAPLHLLVVSDGEDDIPAIRQLLLAGNVSPTRYSAEQFVPAWDQNYNSEQSRRRRSDRINQALSRINLYFFDITGRDSLQQVEKDLNLRKDQMVSIGTRTNLTDELLTRIGVRRYEVVDRERGTRVQGSSTRPEVFERASGPHVLLFAPDDSLPRPFRIGGGEALQVTIPPPPDKPAFNFAGFPQAAALGAARGSITLAPAALEPDFRETLAAYDILCKGQRERRGERDDEGCKFTLMLENKSAGQFTPRPVELWAEVVPLDASGMPQGKFSYANPFPAGGTSTPVYELSVPKWPAGSTRAHVSVWVRMRATSASDSPLVTSEGNAQRKPASPGGLTGVDFKFEAREDKQGAVVKVTESFAASDAAADRQHFVRPATDLGLTRVERTYYDGQVEHQFFLAGRTIQDALAIRVLAVPQERWKKDASGLDDGGTPLDVAITDE